MSSKPLSIAGVISLICAQMLFAAPVSATAPANNVWTAQNAGISGANIVSVAVDPNSSSTVYALTSASGVYKSTDAGSNWAAVNVGLPSDKTVAWSNLSGNLLTMDPATSTTLYTNFGGKPFKTTNGGASWSEISNGIASCGSTYGIAGVAVDPKNSSHLFAGYVASGCAGGLYESNDAGASWVRVNASGIGNDAWILKFNPASSTQLYIATVHIGVSVSSDGGLNWTNTSPTAGDVTGSALEIHPTSTNRIFLGYQPNSGTGTGLYISTDGGVTWTSHVSEVGSIISDIKISSSSPSIGYIAARGGVYKTTDGGLTWAVVGNHAGKSPYSLAINPLNPNIVYMGSAGGGVYKSTDGGVTFSAINTGIPLSFYVPGIAVAPGNSSLYYTTVSGVGFFRSTDRGYTWSKMSSSYTQVNQSNYILVSPTDPNTIYAGFGQVYKSTDGGVTFNLNFDPGGTRYFQAGAIDPGNSSHVIVSENNLFGVWQSYDSGASWATSTSFIPTSYIYGIVFDQSNPAKVYGATYDYFWKSINNGTQWVQVTSTFSGAGNNQLDSIALDPSAPATIYAGTRADKVMKSSDSGATWAATAYPGSAGGSTPQSLRVDPNGIVYAFSGHGWQKSTDHGANWLAISTSGLNSAFYIPKSSFTIDPTDPTRFLIGDFFDGVNIFENYVPTFAPSSTVVAVGNQSAAYPSLGDTFTVTTTVTNAGPASAAGTTLTFTLAPGLGYIADSSQVDGSPVSDPASVTAPVYNLGILSRGQSTVLTFKIKLNQDNSTLAATVTSAEDVAGTPLNSLLLKVSVPNVAQGVVGSGGGGGVFFTPVPSPVPASVAPAATSPSSEALLLQITNLTALIHSLQVKLGLLSGAPIAVPIPYHFIRTLTLGSRGGDVSALQTFLAVQGPNIYPEALVTGYFGLATQRAVQRFQEAHNVVHKGQPGYGVFGPATQAAAK